MSWDLSSIHPMSWNWGLIDLTTYLLAWTLFIAALFVVPRNRKPGEATAWLMLIFLVPFLGFIVYLVFGSPKLSRQRRARQHSMSEAIQQRVASVQQQPELAALVSPPIDDLFRLVMVPANTPPATGSGAPLRGKPPGSTTEIVPSALLPFGAFANHGRPKPLLNEMPSGRLTAGRAFVTAIGFLTPLVNGGLWAVYRMTLPPTALAWPPLRAKSAGTATGLSAPPPTSIERIAPGASSGRASGAPKFELLATNNRCPSRICPGWVEGANAGLS